MLIKPIMLIYGPTIFEKNYHPCYCHNCSYYHHHIIALIVTITLNIGKPALYVVIIFIIIVVVTMSKYKGTVYKRLSP